MIEKYRPSEDQLQRLSNREYQLIAQVTGRKLERINAGLDLPDVAELNDDDIQEILASEQALLARALERQANEFIDGGVLGTIEISA